MLFRAGFTLCRSVGLDVFQLNVLLWVGFCTSNAQIWIFLEDEISPRSLSSSRCKQPASTNIQLPPTRNINGIYWLIDCNFTPCNGWLCQKPHGKPSSPGCPVLSVSTGQGLRAGACLVLDLQSCWWDREVVGRGGDGTMGWWNEVLRWLPGLEQPSCEGTDAYWAWRAEGKPGSS